eukprot:GSMAST32.ASY1.ANO1.953.1 assembled CDS
MVRDFTMERVEPQALEYNREEKFNHDLFKECGEQGLLAFCLSYLAHSLLFVNNLAQNGSEEQKKKYLPDACSGATIGGMCMSEPGVGTDVLGLTTKAVKNNATGGFTLTGQKMWITNGAVSDTDLGDVFLVYVFFIFFYKKIEFFFIVNFVPNDFFFEIFFQKAS